MEISASVIEVVNNSLPVRARTQSITAADGDGFIGSDTTSVSINSADAGEAIQHGGEMPIPVTGLTDRRGENGADLRIHRPAMGWSCRWQVPVVEAVG